MTTPPNETPVLATNPASPGAPLGEAPSRIAATVDLGKDGKQHGYLRVPHSRNDSAWGFVQIPITVVGKGRGPTILLTGAAHGDEYEGPISLMKLSRAIDPDSITGRLIIVPALNLPAVKSATRLSPIDGVNLNRAYPGGRSGSISAMIADYVYRELVIAADIVVDFHSGGKTLDFVPCAVMHQLDDEGLFQQTLEALKAFGAPVGLVLRELDDEGMLDTAVESLGKPFISTELGGAGRVTAETMAITDRGVTNLLRHFGVLEASADPLGIGPAAVAETRLMHTPDADCFIASEHAGMFEMVADLGATVRKGDPVGRVHFHEDASAPAVTYLAGHDGLVLSRHCPGLIQRGDCLAVIATDFPSR
ncbi:succinylglutamate desuccinylase/aspartoacylase family protein [Fodinicurvata sp. EGI_FJ10296]|uniref:succinylglutamate desuccinylase/aspartoacylase domain-containing protein n=1 Tax=Fodinicurvata sp. EGI_FJ10296 TaxID=3231908 RepID=UPI0034573A68